MTNVSALNILSKTCEIYLTFEETTKLVWFVMAGGYLEWFVIRHFVIIMESFNDVVVSLRSPLETVRSQVFSKVYFQQNVNISSHNKC